MSERNHSEQANAPQAKPQATAPKTAKGRMVPVMIGTAGVMIVAGIMFQWLRPGTASSQTTPQAAGAPQSSEVLARVNGEPIHYETVARDAVERHGAEILDNLINRTIIQQACDQRGVTVTPAEVQQEVIDIASKFNLPLETWYQMLQSERGITAEQYHRDVIWPMLALKKLAGGEVNVTEEDMFRAFERDYGPRVRARLILIEGNNRQASEIWNKCNAAPDTFDALAREYSADPNTRPLGGLIPPIRRFGGDPRIEEAAFAMQPGQISNLIAIDGVVDRYVILKCEGFTEPLVNDIRQVWDELLAQITEEKVQESVAITFENLRQSAEIHNRLTQTSSAGSPYAGAHRTAEVQQTSGANSFSGTATDPPGSSALFTQPTP